MKGSDVISLLALVVSLGSAISSYAVWKLSGPRLKVSIDTVTLVGEGPMRGTLSVNVTNTGRAATTIQRWHVRSRTSAAILSPGGQWNMGPKTPLRLESHESRTWFIDYQEAKAALLRDHPNELHELEAVVTFGGKTVRSRGVVSVATGANLARRSRLQRLQDDAKRTGVAALWIGADGRDEWDLVLHNAGTAPVRNVTVDRLPMGPASAGGPAITRRVLLPGRSWTPNIPDRPDSQTGLNGEAWVRIRAQSLFGRRGEFRIGEPDTLPSRIDPDT